MFIAFLVSVLCGYLAPRLDDTLSRPIIELLARFLPIEEGQVRVVSVMLAMLIAAILAAIFGSISAFAVISGVILGYFLEDLIEHNVRKKNKG